jgi:hypothetical protein
MPTNKSKITIQFFDTCYGDAKTKRGTTTRYETLEQATAAAEEYAADRGYPCEGFLCETCKCFHVRMSTVERDIPEERRWTPANVRARRARLKAIADEERARENAERARMKAIADAERYRLKAIADAARAAEKPAAPERQLSNKKGALRFRKIRADRLAQGLCGFCGSPATPEYKTCEKCRRKNKVTSEASLERKRLASQKPDSIGPACAGLRLTGDRNFNPAPLLAHAC